MSIEKDPLDYLQNEQPEYEERADYLTEEQLTAWTATSEHFEFIQKKLLQVGAKLIVGPRGTGKTHQMKCAYFACSEDKEKPLALYITFNHYLRLESYLHKESNAINIFHAWVLSKIALECMTQYKVEFEKNSKVLSVESIQEFIHDAERNLAGGKHSDIISSINIHKVQALIDKAIEKEGRKRAVLLLDDAGLTLTHDYMVEFFDIFRSIKSIRISPKASVYPGTTKYGPRFHLGQDAEQISIWMNVEDRDYLQFMNSIVDKRFSSTINIETDIQQLFMYCAFGIPRAYIMFLRSFIESSKRGVQSKFNAIIQEKCGNIEAEYYSLAQKIPQYGKIITTGHEFFKSILEQIGNKNKQDSTTSEYKKTITIGIQEIDDKAERMIKFLIEAGLLYEQGQVSHGTDRQLRRFTPHLAFLIKDRVFVQGKTSGLKQMLDVLSKPSMKHPLRRKFNSVISDDLIKNIVLDLPPCNTCGATRIMDGQKYCHICGSPLVDGSIFSSCMQKRIEELPLTDFQKKVLDYLNLRTVEDIITADDLSGKLMQVHRVGPKYSEKIETRITTWINEFLY